MKSHQESVPHVEVVSDRGLGLLGRLVLPLLVLLQLVVQAVHNLHILILHPKSLDEEVHNILVGEPGQLLEDLVGEERGRDDVLCQGEVAHAICYALGHELIPEEEVADHGSGKGDVHELQLDL